VPILEVPLGLIDRRVATAARSKPVTRRMKRRLIDGLEHLPHGLHHHPIDHVRDPQPALPATRLRDQRPANLARTPSSLQQVAMQPRQHGRPLLTQHLDRHAVRAGSALVRHHLQQRRRQPAGNLPHRHRRAGLRVDDRLRHPHRTRAPLRDFCCRDRQAQLHRRFLDRDRLPLPAGARPGGLSGHYPAVRYYAVLRLLLGHRPSSPRPPAYRPPSPAPSRSPGVRRTDFVVIASPIRPRSTDRNGASLPRASSPHPRNALRRFTFVRHHNASTASFRPALTETRPR
jgi:hypothetical protein